MPTTRALEQHIAVFGESGSGKTVLLSSFYGAAQENENIKRDGFAVVAENPAQSVQLSQNYLGMKKSATLPPPNRFEGKSYSFLVKLKEPSNAAAPFKALRLVWHDYPGEWFEQDVSGPTEAQHRLETFQKLLGSDVALLVVDGQKLLEHAGSEGSYLKSLFTNYCQQLQLLKDDLLTDGKPLVKFPRIWVMALSKSDLLPETTVEDFRELLLEKAGSDIIKLRDVIAELVEGSNALAVGEDFLLLSSAKFDPAKIHVDERVGLDLILPLASVLPFQRHMKWAKSMNLPRKVAVDLLSDVETVALALGLVGAFISRLLASRSKLLGAVATVLSRAVPELVKWASGTLTEADRSAIAKQNSVAAALLEFPKRLDAGEKQQVLHLGDK
ncbi:hypothetical protein [Brevundimonas sp.]|jgi:energy-coupling factor transporter ATP-binding protein EcfA2|uniref:TRAFAC clade GTPase domain-containing protein n=1 Tax=Brevundimonas sp. TaxID=1871086 RepID=UPI0037845352